MKYSKGKEYELITLSRPVIHNKDPLVNRLGYILSAPGTIEVEDGTFCQPPYDTLIEALRIVLTLRENGISAVISDDLVATLKRQYKAVDRNTCNNNHQNQVAFEELRKNLVSSGLIDENISACSVKLDDSAFALTQKNREFRLDEFNWHRNRILVGFEINTPIFHSTKELNCLQKRILNTLEARGGVLYSKTCSFQTHFGVYGDLNFPPSKNLNNETLYLSLENVGVYAISKLFWELEFSKFLLPISRRSNKFCKILSKHIEEDGNKFFFLKPLTDRNGEYEDPLVTVSREINLIQQAYLKSPLFSESQNRLNTLQRMAVKIVSLITPFVCDAALASFLNAQFNCFSALSQDDVITTIRDPRHKSINFLSVLKFPTVEVRFPPATYNTDLLEKWDLFEELWFQKCSQFSSASIHSNSCSELFIDLESYDGRKVSFNRSFNSLLEFLECSESHVFSQQDIALIQDDDYWLRHLSAATLNSTSNAYIGLPSDSYGNMLEVQSKTHEQSLWQGGQTRVSTQEVVSEEVLVIIQEFMNGSIPDLGLLAHSVSKLS
ncbi:hypothetical protein IQ241_24355 [Romeria aff. gracilis LEGE 07310]|uniref:Uncharacterized protein n=1 Tax=Vasconcelosia minhoensis LEGE 07310 TaxID=915328 RepID=A0A8J7B126_9CYAN|nr:hypothetical protein [Romeria gracilis]MBE9080382.1 hypothetical protein [Romeria aff. gracilis LEGE 07310]